MIEGKTLIRNIRRFLDDDVPVTTRVLRFLFFLRLKCRNKISIYYKRSRCSFWYTNPLRVVLDKAEQQLLILINIINIPQ